MMSSAELDDLLTKPSDRLIEDLQKIEGDILILGIGGKMGPSLARLAKRAIQAGGIEKRIIGVSRFSDPAKRAELEAFGIETIQGDLLDDAFLQSLPAVKNVLFMAGQKFGTSGKQAFTWAMNTYLPARVADKFKHARIVAFSTGNVYPFMDVKGKGATEDTPTAPIGEYAQSCLGRERMFEYFSMKNQTPVLLYRLNYALDLKYGVLNDIARKVWEEAPIDLSMGYVNVIWQGDANEYAIRSLLHCQTPANILNITGPETLELKALAETFGRLMQKTPLLVGEAQATALLNDSSKAHSLMGAPSISIQQMMEWTVAWVKSGGEELNKPTHFQTRDGKF